LREVLCQRLSSILSGYLERQRDEYVRRLQAVRERGEYEAWVSFFLRGVAEQATAAVRTAEALIELDGDFRERLRRIKARGHAVDAAEGLIGNPYVSPPRLAEILGLTRQGGAYVIATLQRAGIIGTCCRELATDVVRGTGGARDLATRRRLARAYLDAL